MKRKFTKMMAAVALLTALFIPMGMWGQATTYTSNVTLPQSGTNVASCKVVISDTQYDGTKLGKSGSGASANITIPSGTTKLYVHCAGWKAKSPKLALSTTASNVSISPSGDWSLTSDDGISNNSPFTLANPEKASTDYFREYTLTGVTQDIDVKFEAKSERAVFWGVNAVSGSAPTIAAPTFNPAGGTYTSAQSVSISCETQGATIYYTTDGSTPDNTSTEYTTAIPVSSTTTIKAIAYVDNDASSVATATYTILTMKTIAEARAQATGAVYTQGTVTSCVGSTGYIQDATAAICVYGTTLTVGDNITVQGTLTTYSGLLEITNPVVNVVSSGNIVNPTVMTIEEINEDYANDNEWQGWFITIENATVTNIATVSGQQNTTIAQGDNTVVIRGSLGTGVDVEVGDVITLDGNIGCFNGVQIANPQNVTVQENENPTITVNPATAETFTYVVGDGPSEDQVFEVTGENLTSTAITVSVAQDGAFEITDDVEYGYTLTIASGDVFSVRMKADLEAGSYSGTVTLSSDGAANVTIALNGTVTAPEAPHYTWDLSVASYASASETQVIWTSSYATMVIDKASAGTNANNYLGGSGNYTSTRFYKNSELTITPATGYAIASVVFEATTTGYASALQGSTWTNATASVNNNMTVTVTPTDGTDAISAVIGGTCGFTSVTVYYETSSVVYYNIELTEVENGTIAASKTRAQAGETITLTATPAENYYVTEWTILDGEANEVEYQGDELTEVTFIMPASDVVVGATFATDLVYYTISIDNTIVNGTVTADMQQALEGATITLTITPAAGYVFEEDNLLVLAGSDEVEVTKVNATTYTFEMPAANVEITAEFTEYTGGDLYTLTTTIESGKHYIIASGKEGTAYVMGGQNNNNRAAVAQTVEDEMIMTTSPDVREFVINGPDADGNYTIYDAQYPGYLFAASSGSNYLRTETHLDSDNNGLWTITFGDNDNAVITAQGNNTRNLMRFNPGNSNTAPIFSCYGSGQQPVYLYVKDDDTNYEFFKDIAGYGQAENGNYYLIASPVASFNPENTVITSNNYDLYAFDEAQDKEWRNYEAQNFNIAPGKGYLYANSENVTIAFTGSLNTNASVTLNKTDEAQFSGMNLVGNPFGQVAYINKTFYRMNEDGDEVIEDSGAINPMEGIFVVASSNGETLNFSTTAPGKGAAVAMNVNGTRGNVIDRAIVRFDEGDQLPKFQLNPNNTKIYVTEGNQDFAVVRSAAEGEMPVNFRAAENGTYTISVNTENVEMDYLHLIDNMTGADVDLLATPSYSFEARTTDYTSRFRLVFSGNGTNENGATTVSETFAYFNGSEWQISNMGEATLQVVDVMGRIVKNETISGNASISINEVPGVYVMRLVNGENVKTQKIVVK